MKRAKKQKRKVEIPFGLFRWLTIANLVWRKTTGYRIRSEESIGRIDRNRVSLDSQISTGIAGWTNPSPRSCYPSGKQCSDCDSKRSPRVDTKRKASLFVCSRTIRSKRVSSTGKRKKITSKNQIGVWPGFWNGSIHALNKNNTNICMLCKTLIKYMRISILFVGTLRNDICNWANCNLIIR